MELRSQMIFVGIPGHFPLLCATKFAWEEGPPSAHLTWTLQTKHCALNGTTTYLYHPSSLGRSSGLLSQRPLRLSGCTPRATAGS